LSDNSNHAGGFVGASRIITNSSRHSRTNLIDCTSLQLNDEHFPLLIGIHQCDDVSNLSAGAAPFEPMNAINNVSSNVNNSLSQSSTVANGIGTAHFLHNINAQNNSECDAA
jgi:hypothetical protein